ncbi:MAG TPA: hybrid sensor histidine kinase/response regulator [Coleofasciculaceae cyanobacterium]
MFKASILIVDDTPENLRFLSTTLTEQGYEVLTAINGSLALMGAKTARPDLILLDIKMPGIDGYEVCRQLKIDEQTREIPVIFLSFLDEPWDKVTAFAVGGVDYVTKPFQTQEVLARVENHLTLRALQKQLTEKNLQLCRLESELRLALENEKELNKLRSDFMALISHEFRTPLTTISSSNQMLRRYSEKLSAEKKQVHHDRIESAVEQMTQLLEEVLLIGRAEAGMLKLELTHIDVVGVCHQIVETLQFSTTQHQLIFSTTSQEFYAELDPKILGHILTNLLSNAIKYSPDGGTIQFDLITTGKSVVLRVQDRGIGIPAKDLPQLFESFARASNVGSIQGTGLGLTMVKKSVDLQGGKITVESKEGVGTTFTVMLPIAHMIPEESAMKHEDNCIC